MSLKYEPSSEPLHIVRLTQVFKHAKPLVPLIKMRDVSGLLPLLLYFSQA